MPSRANKAVAKSSRARAARTKLPRAKASELAAYQRKRDFEVTAEPQGSVGKGAGRSFVVQKHDASHLHYDFRLELDGVLKSWAVPKGPSLDPAEKRLAIHVEDHPLDYGGFEGTIPAGQYGGGTVLLWDRGSWQPLGDARADYEAGKLKFTLDGEKLRGGWMLVRRGGSHASADEKNWFLFKERDEYSRPHEEYSVTEQEPRSVKSGRDVADIAAGNPAQRGKVRQAKAVRAKTKAKPTSARSARAVVKKSGGTPAKPAPKKSQGPRRVVKAAKKSSGHTKAVHKRAATESDAIGSVAPLPRFVEPQLATLVKAAPDGSQWLHEIKFDGYRMLCRIAGAKARFLSRSGQDWTDRFRTLVDAAQRLLPDDVLLDGEVVVLLESGISSFQALQNVLSEHGGGQLVYYAFDVLYASGRDLRSLTLAARQQVLARLLKETERGPLRRVEHLDGSGPEFFAQACRHGLEGIISKRRDRPYRSGRSEEWVKTKCAERAEFVIVGYTNPGGARSGFGALLLGYDDGAGRLTYAGRVGTGFSEQTLAELSGRLHKLDRQRTALEIPPPKDALRGVHWVAPRLVAEVQFSNWTTDGLLRHPSFQGLREDKPAAEVVRDRPRSLASGTTASAQRAKGSVVREAGMKKKPPAAARAGDEVAGVRITHPDRVLYPEVKLTKLDIASYYAAVADWMLPHIVGRPLSLVRAPDGRLAANFYQKHAWPGLPAALETVQIREQNKSASYLVVRDVAGLVSLVQFGVLEMHVWGARSDDVERPDRLVFDFDPDPSLEWKRVVAAARGLRERLADLGLTSFVKTSGGKGLHVVVPIRRRDGWEDAKAFCRHVAEAMALDAPQEFTVNMSKAARVGKIYVDYLRNERGATWVAPYSTRARTGAPVSVPLAWEELSPRIRADYFTVKNVPARLGKLKANPWQEIDQVRQSITAKMKKAVGG